MPRENIDYSKTIIYKIVCKDINIKDCYVGSTTDFIRRKSEHKKHVNKDTVKSYYYIYDFIKNNEGWDNWEMIEIEKYNASDKLDSLKRERFWLEELKATLNKKTPSKTHNESRNDWRKKNIEKVREQNKKDKEKYKEKITCDCGCIIRKDGIIEHNKSQKHLILLRTK